jgi:hypothetical protein
VEGREWRGVGRGRGRKGEWEGGTGGRVSGRGRKGGRGRKEGGGGREGGSGERGEGKRGGVGRKAKREGDYP